MFSMEPATWTYKQTTPTGMPLNCNLDILSWNRLGDSLYRRFHEAELCRAHKDDVVPVHRVRDFHSLGGVMGPLS
jgi:hypothetical protein